MISKKTEVLVIGSGLSGIMAAAAAAQTGQKVTLAAKGMGVLGLTSGCIDLWGYGIDRVDEFCRRPLEEIARLVMVNPRHPYAVAQDMLEESLDFFLSICRERGCSYQYNRGDNWLLPTSLGTVRPTYLAPAGMAADLSRYGRIVVVGFSELKDFFPGMIVANLKQNASLNPGCEVIGRTVSAGGIQMGPNTLAHQLEQPGVIQRVAARIKAFISPDTLVLLPPVMGEDLHRDVMNSLSGELECRCLEVAGVPPALPGQRLYKALLGHLKARGVEVIAGCTVEGGLVSDNRCRWVTATGGGRSMQISAGAFVLATGSFLGGGLQALPGQVREGIFGLPVETSRQEWSSADFLSREGQPFSRFGIRVNNLLLPVDQKGAPLVENLMVVGSNLAGCNYPVEKCGGGVALSTGYKAGRLAGGMTCE